MTATEFWIVAGPNGAGKTSSVSKEPISNLLPSVKFLNPDDRTLEKLLAFGYQGFQDASLIIQRSLFLESANEVYVELESLLRRGGRAGIETVLSTAKYLALAEKVIQGGGFVGLIYIALSSPAISKERVAARVSRGGHGVPDDMIEQRWGRSLEYLPLFAIKATKFWVYDNSESIQQISPRLIATGTYGVLSYLNESAFPELKAALLKLPQ